MKKTFFENSQRILFQNFYISTQDFNLLAWLKLLTWIDAFLEHRLSDDVRSIVIFLHSLRKHFPSLLIDGFVKHLLETLERVAIIERLLKYFKLAYKSIQSLSMSHIMQKWTANVAIEVITRFRSFIHPQTHSAGVWHTNDLITKFNVVNIEICSSFANPLHGIRVPIRTLKTF